MRESKVAAMKFTAIIFLVSFTIFADAGKGGSKFCKTADEKLGVLKTLIENMDCPSQGTTRTLRHVIPFSFN